MALHATRRSVLASLGMAATAGTALLSPQRREGSPALTPTVPEGTWKVPGADSARTKHVPGATPPTTDARIAWETSVDATPFHLSIAIDEDTVYVPVPDGLTALDGADGAERWRLDTERYWPASGDDIRAGPIVTGDRVLLATSRRLLGVDAGTGHVQWVYDNGGPLKHAVLAGQAVFLQDATTKSIVAVDAETGARWLRWSTDGFWSPVAVVDQTLVGYASGSVAAFHPRTGDRLWQTETPGGVGLPTMSITGAGNVVVVGSNPLVALDLEDGTESWRYEARTGEDELETFKPATDGDRVYVSAYWAGETVAFDARTGERVWQVDRALGSPIVANGTVYCFDEDRITAIGATDGRQRGGFGSTLVQPDGVAETLAAVGDRLYAAFAPEHGYTRPTVFALEAP